ncbi:MAG: hypothetical protein LUQ48_07595, partial [Methylococcaceae bacterium]|nr:hypothetical protein [Methylococcaceae bacterium]
MNQDYKIKMKKGFLVPLTLCASLTCQANDYYFDPVFSIMERYYSNLFLFTDPQQDNWITNLSPGLNFGMRHENGDLKANFTWNQLFYTNQSALDVSEQLFSLAYNRKSERLLWGASGYYNNQASTNTQGTVLGVPGFTQVMAKQLSIAPTVSYALDEQSSLAFDYSYNKTTYDKNTTSFLIDYDYHQASGVYSYLYTEKDKLNVTLSSSRYHSPTQDFTTYNNVAQLGWQHSFSEQIVTYLSAGMNYAVSETQLRFLGYNSEGLPVYLDPQNGLTLQQQYNKTALGAVYQASVKKSFEKGSASLVGLQNQTPTSQGLQTQTQVAIDAAYTINERWTSGLSSSYTVYEVT